MVTNDSSASTLDPTSYRNKFIILLALEIPSIIASLTIFIHFATSRAVRSIDHQHSIIVLLAISFFQVLTDVAMALDFYRFDGIVRIQTVVYCLGWVTIDYSFFASSAFLMAWISIERHLLIFHRQSLGGVGTWKTWSLHVAPWLICPLWAFLFYTVTIVISPMCTSEWFFDTVFCGQPCYLSTNWGTVDIFANVVFPVAVISVGNIVLISRVIHQRKTAVARAAVNWRRQRKMVLQLAAISTLYLLVWLPLSLIQLVQLYIDPMFLAPQLDTFNFLAYIGPLALAVVCMPSIPQLSKRLENLTTRRRRVAIVPPLV